MFSAYKQMDLFTAAREGNLAEVQRLLAVPGTDVNAKNNNMPALYVAAQNGNVDVVRASTC